MTIRTAPSVGIERRALDRIAAVDIARGLALVGMFFAHLLPGDAETLADGRPSVLFATLAGVSLGLLTGGSSPAPKADRGGQRGGIAIRALLLITLGLLLWTLDSGIAIILDYYGVFFLALLPVLFAPRAVLLPVALAFLTVGTAVLGSAPDDPLALTGSIWLYLPAEWFVTGYYPGLLWLAYPLMGLILARSDLRSRRTQLIALAGGATASVAGYGGGRLLGQDVGAHSNTLWEGLGAGGLAVAIIAALLLATAARPVALALYPLAAAGSMPLTLYTAQILAITAMRAAAPSLGVTDQQQVTLLVILLVGGIAAAVAWRLLLGKGPLERLMTLASRRPAP